MGYRTFLRPPDNSPAEACAKGPGARPRVVAAGASMTQGALGADWVGALRAALPAYEFVTDLTTRWLPEAVPLSALG
ncbi:hypothetical protein ACIBI7_47020 [Nonomuraea fuscirosea]|uniref:hypothetical protein n=1 Tax=Nonomuraea fuscirosea TaxID=1291556 RepID=UPI00348EC8E2